jgi:hypothetical protein
LSPSSLGCSVGRATTSVVNEEDLTKKKANDPFAAEYDGLLDGTLPSARISRQHPPLPR